MVHIAYAMCVKFYKMKTKIAKQITGFEEKFWREIKEAAIKESQRKLVKIGIFISGAFFICN